MHVIIKIIFKNKNENNEKVLCAILRDCKEIQVFLEYYNILNNICIHYKQLKQWNFNFCFAEI